MTIAQAFRQFRDALTSRLYDFPRAAPVAVFLAAAGLTTVAVVGDERRYQLSRQTMAYEQANEIAAEIGRQAAAYTSVLRAAAVMFETIRTVPDGVFRRFVDQAALDDNFRGAEGIGWSLVIPRGSIEAVEQSMRDNGRPDFRVWPTPRADEAIVHSIVYLEPQTAANMRVYGFNMASEARRRAAMAAAARTGRPMASAMVQLKQARQNDPQPGFLIYMPAYDVARLSRGVPRTAALKGHVYSPFRADLFVAAALANSPARYGNFAIRDGTINDEIIIPSRRAFAIDEGVNAAVNVAGRRWIVSVEAARPGWISTGSGALLVSGLLIALLLSMLMWIIIARAREDRITVAAQRQQESIRSTLTRELNHRVKNTLANVLSIITLTRRGADDLDDYVDALTGRIRALSATHDLLTGSDWSVTPVADVVRAELAPYYDDASGTRVVLDGPTIYLAPSDALALGLAVHELSTNAAKYGALSVPDGRVTVRWHRHDDKIARLTWVESGGPPVAPRTRRGFGSNLVERIIAAELGSEVTMDFHPDGLRCTLFLPVREMQQFRLRADQPD